MGYHLALRAFSQPTLAQNERRKALQIDNEMGYFIVFSLEF
jgi:hypothetical protein